VCVAEMSEKNWLKGTLERLNLDKKHPVVSGWIAFALGIVFMMGFCLFVFVEGWRDLGFSA